MQDLDEKTESQPVVISQERIRDSYIQSQLKLRFHEFSEVRPLSVCIGTWNVNAQKPVKDLTQWVHAFREEHDEADIYAFGFQEIVDLNATNLVVDHNMSKTWEDAIESSFKKGTYHQVASTHLVGLSLCVYAKKSLKDSVTRVFTQTCGVGIMGIGGNKGAVGIVLQIYDTSLCFVNAHLAAHQNNVAGRNADYRSITTRLQFPDIMDVENTFSIFHYDMIFWLGDLNYRLNMNDDLDKVYELIHDNNLKELLLTDQLISERKKKNAFSEFTEGEITFLPTYKYINGTDEYDRRPDKKMRMPAWCDRILWKGDDIEQIKYCRAELAISDHKPVISLFNIKAQHIVPNKKKKVVDNINRQLDRSENEAIPKIKLEPVQVIFDTGIYFDMPQKQIITISNIGTVMATFFFVSHSNNNHLCKPWLQVSPQYGMVAPGDTTQVELTVHVTREYGHALNTGDDILEENLIMRLEHGPDYFITVEGEYRKSCFGATVEYLVHHSEPIRFSDPNTPSKDPLRLPKELWRIVDYLFNHGVKVQGLFQEQGSSDELSKIRECLDTGTEFPNVSIHSMAETLVLFLEYLHEPVFPMGLVEQYNASVDLGDWCEEALLHLSPSQHNVFVYIIAFLRELLKYTNSNGLTVNTLTLIFSACLIRYRGVSKSAKKPKPWIILNHLLSKR